MLSGRDLSKHSSKGHCDSTIVLRKNKGTTSGAFPVHGSFLSIYGACMSLLFAPGYSTKWALRIKMIEKTVCFKLPEH
jgi:hypothetical protein